MIKTLFIVAVLVVAAFAVSASAMHFADESGSGEPDGIEPRTCQEEIVELQNMLHAANQTIELLMDENRELKETIDRIRREIDMGGYAPSTETGPQR